MNNSKSIVWKRFFGCDPDCDNRCKSLPDVSCHSLEKQTRADSMQARNATTKRLQVMVPDSGPSQASPVGLRQNQWALSSQSRPSTCANCSEDSTCVSSVSRRKHRDASGSKVHVCPTSLFPSNQNDSCEAKTPPLASGNDPCLDPCPQHQEQTPRRRTRNNLVPVKRVLFFAEKPEEESMRRTIGR